MLKDIYKDQAEVKSAGAQKVNWPFLVLSLDSTYYFLFYIQEI